MALEKLAAFSTPSLFAFIFDLKASNSNRNSAHSLAMPLFSSTPPASPSHTTPAPSADGAYIAPDRNARAHCWEARDTFFACLERNDIVDSIKEKEKAGSVCGNEDREFGKECAKSWVSLETFRYYFRGIG